MNVKNGYDVSKCTTWFIVAAARVWSTIIEPSWLICLYDLLSIVTEYRAFSLRKRQRIECKSEHNGTDPTAVAGLNCSKKKTGKIF
jgi:hypothetical protein